MQRHRHQYGRLNFPKGAKKTEREKRIMYVFRKIDSYAWQKTIFTDKWNSRNIRCKNKMIHCYLCYEILYFSIARSRIGVLFGDIPTAIARSGMIFKAAESSSKRTLTSWTIYTPLLIKSIGPVEHDIVWRSKFVGGLHWPHQCHQQKFVVFCR